MCVGWYVSHTRTEITLTESDQEIFSTFFAQPWQVTLVVRPSRGGNMRAGFFVREPDGTVKASAELPGVQFPGPAGGGLRPSRDLRASGKRRSTAPEYSREQRTEFRSEYRSESRPESST